MENAVEKLNNVAYAGRISGWLDKTPEGPVHICIHQRKRINNFSPKLTELTSHVHHARTFPPTPATTESFVVPTCA